MRCHNCQKLGHYAKECSTREGAKNKPKIHANLSRDEGSLTVEGTGKVVFRNTDGKETIIEEVLYVPGIKTNLLSLSQLL
ncbi:hypothetical protein CR513_41174, partial [Mucuna pruriens]